MKNLTFPLLLMFCLALLFTACEQRNQSDLAGTDLDADTTREVNEDIVYELVEAMNNRDFDRAFENLSDDYVYHGEEDVHGKEELKEMMEGYMNAFPDMQMEVVHVVSEDDIVAYHLKGTGTHTGELEGMPPTNKPVNARSMGFMRIENGQVVEEWEIFDAMGLMMQLGVMPGADTTSANGADTTALN